MRGTDNVRQRFCSTLPKNHGCQSSRTLTTSNCHLGSRGGFSFIRPYKLFRTTIGPARYDDHISRFFVDHFIPSTTKSIPAILPNVDHSLVRKPSQRTMRDILTFGVVFIVLLAGFYFFLQENEQPVVHNQDSNGETSEAETATSTKASSSESTTAYVALQENESGDVINISSATLTEPGFIAVYRVDDNGDTTLIGNSEHLMVGSYSEMQIQLDSAVTSDETVAAVLHADSDDDRSFGYPESDGYMGNNSVPTISDIDIIDVEPTNESETRKAQVEAYLESGMSDES